jgi:hypothetical protein
MDEPLVLWKWWIRDERTGKRRLTTYRLTDADALRQFPGAEREPSSREERRGHGSAARIVTQKFDRKP